MKKIIKSDLIFINGKMILFLLLMLAVASTAAAQSGPKRPEFLFDIGPLVTLHYLDHKAVDNYFEKLGMDKTDEMTLGYGLGSRILVGPFILSSLGEGWSSNTSGNGSNAQLWGLSFIGRTGFTLIRRTFLSCFYFGGGINYSEMNINGVNGMEDFSGWKLGLPGDVGISFDYLFPVGKNKSNKSDYSSQINFPIGVEIGYSGEIIADPWYERTGHLADQARDRFMGWYLRFRVNIGVGSYQHGNSAFQFPGKDLWPKSSDQPAKPDQPEEPKQKTKPEKEEKSKEDSKDDSKGGQKR